MVKGSGSGQSTMSTPITNIREGIGMVKRNTVDLDACFLCGNSKSRGLLRDDANWEGCIGGAAHIRISKKSSSPFLPFTY